MIATIVMLALIAMIALMAMIMQSRKLCIFEVQILRGKSTFYYRTSFPKKLLFLKELDFLQYYLVFKQSRKLRLPTANRLVSKLCNEKPEQ